MINISLTETNQRKTCKQISLALFFIIGFTNLSAQTNLDSLYKVWLDTSKNNSERTEAFEEYIYEKYVYTTPDSAIINANKLISFGKANNYIQAQSYGYEIIGEAYYQEDILDLSLQNFKLALQYAEQAGIDDNVILLNTIGAIYSDIGNSAKGLEYFQKSLKISRNLGDKETIEMCISNIGGIYYMLENYDRALEYFEEGLQLEKEMNDTIGYTTSLKLTALVLIEQEDFTKALSRIEQALSIFKEQEFEEGVLECYFSMGSIYRKQEKYSLALEYFKKSIANPDGTLEPNLFVFNKMGSIYKDLGRYAKAIELCQKSYNMAIESGIATEEKDACDCLYKAYKQVGNTEKAFYYLEKTQDFLSNFKTQEANNLLQNMEVEKQMLKDSIAAAKERQIRELAYQKEVQKKNYIRNIIIVIALFILVIAFGLYNRWRSTQKSKAIIEKEKNRSESLLLNILPADVARELKEKGSADARDFDLVSILFTDFKGFTKASESLSPKELVREINTCFKVFDHIIGRYEIEKIKTIGDAYMAAGGLPIPDEKAVKNTVLAALEMQSFITNRKQEKDIQQKTSFEMRVGVHTGPIVAGIVGVKKFQYDIWGDTVNTASRIESSGEVGKVNISQSTYELLKDDKDFTFESRGNIEAKGKGEIQMWFVELNPNSKLL